MYHVQGRHGKFLVGKTTTAATTSLAYCHCRHQVLFKQIQAKSQIREQMSVPDLYVVTVAFLALKKNGFSEVKFFSQIFFEKF